MPRPTSRTGSQLSDKTNSEPAHNDGWLGRLLGQDQTAVIRGVIIIGVLSTIGFILIGGWSSSPNAPDVLKGLSAIVLATLTFLGGISNGSRRR